MLKRVFSKALSEVVSKQLAINTKIPYFFCLHKPYYRFSQLIGDVQSNPYNNKKNSQEEQIFTNIQAQQQQNVRLQNYIDNGKSIRSLKRKGIQKLLPIQFKTYKIIYDRKDLIASDRTGSGKTIAFSLPIIERFRKLKLFQNTNGIKLLILTPTRQLAVQICNQIQSIRHNFRQFSCLAVYGGSSISTQMYSLRNSPSDIVVATPGRLKDLYNRGYISFQELQTICLDEADYMLERGFHEDVEQIYERIMQQAKKKPQSLYFSATMPEWVKELSMKYMRQDRHYINLINQQSNKTSQSVEHYFVKVLPIKHFQAIRNTIKNYNIDGRTIIFTKTKLEADDIGENLQMENAVLHSDISQVKRLKRLEQFKRGHIKVLVATDVASRGLDIPNVQLVIQSQPPQNPQPYIHRSGRTGRVGKKGICVTFISSKKAERNFNQIEKQANIMVKALDIGLNQQDIKKAQRIIERQRQPYSMKKKPEKSFSKKEENLSEQLREYFQNNKGYKVFISGIPQELNQKDIVKKLKTLDIQIIDIIMKKGLINDQGQQRKQYAFCEISNKQGFMQAVYLRKIDFGALGKINIRMRKSKQRLFMR